MTLVKRFAMTGTLIVLMLFVAGCNNEEKRTVTIYQTLEKTASIENGFAEKQQTSVDVGQEEQAMYNKIISLKFEQKDEMNQLINEAKKLNKKQKKLIQEAKKRFNKAYQTFTQIKQVVKKMDDPSEKKKITAIINLMEERKELVASYYEQYAKALRSNDQLYEKIQNNELDASIVDKRINSINQHYKTMKKQEKEFNRKTKKYNQERQHYYQTL
ncbi:hypothetical protein FFL34_13435 [Lentibacillus cibarius]|uniref:YkyA family protein n=1 Tax=Lentibacillus cibarius TaxID=2583219 RepID=A0A5S3QLZ7_9BACI|nr:hypothetical protein FFL34_13435 [Lentibacillus cibarius]